ncbi:uncharacterized protein TNIN_457451 [Trichonephila inaurata madagascariensis]|uniref:Uncharacterized protein n=1 Tax=Trichonephila inaurata madagascariensis TaxID=2747483 RepID=A0A8X7CFF5_9ARAC|nr:uncharacterized protein TNIN_457451 [Trichonephila inaurata madagascariensis]
MNQLPIQVLILSLLAVSSVIAYRGFDDDFVNYKISADKCVSKSGDQELCDNFIACNDIGPKRLKDLYDMCIRKHIGHLGKCNDKDTLYGTSEEYSKYLHCLLDGLPQKSSLSDEDQKLFNVDYHKCVYKYGGKCFKEHGNES